MKEVPTVNIKLMHTPRPMSYPLYSLIQLLGVLRIGVLSAEQTSTKILVSSELSKEYNIIGDEN